MALLQSLGKLLGRAANTVGSDISQGARAVAQPIGRLENAAVGAIERPVVKAWQTVNPNSGYNQAKPVVQQAQARYGFSPAFQALVNGGNPSFTKGFNQNGIVQKGSNITGEYLSNNPVNQLQIAGESGNAATDTLVHEALHRQWGLNPNDHQNFISAYNQGSTPILRSYLANRLAAYNDFRSGPTNQLMDLNSAPSQVQNEVHSYIPEFYASHPDYALDGSLADYYSRFYDVNGPMKYKQATRALNQLLQGKH